MATTKTHWKKAFNPNYLGAWSLEENKDLIVTIEEARQEMLKNPDGKEEECLVLYLRGQKPMVCNKTNAATIAKVLGTPYLEEWPGCMVQLYVAKVKAFGEVVPALRVRATSPKKRKLTAGQFSKMLDAIEANRYDKLEALESFDLTEAQKKELAAL